MFRKILSLAVEAVKVEIGHWQNPAREFGPGIEATTAPYEPQQATAVQAPESWTLEKGQAEWRAKWEQEPRCPFCAKPKPAGVVMCKPCDDVRESLRARAAKARGAIRVT